MIGLTICKLVADTRERHVLRHDDEFAGIRREIAQLTTGDYAILTPAGHVLAIIERKSLEDYGASLKDGRHENRHKMLALRASTGCSVIYVVEGFLFPDPSDTFAGVAYRAIESSIFHIMVRDGITVIRTRDTLDTARMLARFVRSMDTIHPPADPADDADLIIGAAEDISMCALRAKHAKSDQDVAREMWATFAGITKESADVFIARWSMLEVIRAEIPRADISEMRSASGRKFSSRTVAALTGEISALSQIRLLTAVPGISESTAARLLDGISLDELLAKMQLGCDIFVGERKLGPILVERTCKLFAHKTCKR